MKSRIAWACALGLLWVILAAPARARDDVVGVRDFDAAVTRVGDVTAAPSGSHLRRSSSRDGDWAFFVGPYGWLASVDGTIVSGGVDTDVSVPFSDLVDLAKGGFQLNVGIWWRRFFLGFDGTWAKLGMEAEGRFFGAELEIEQRLFDIKVGYQLFRKSLDGCLDPRCEKWRRWASLDVFVGARYWYTKTTVTVTGPAGIPRGLEGVDERWDPLVGLRLTWNPARRWTFLLRGDIGGFGIGDAAEFAWQTSAGLGYSVTEWMHIFLGYRAIGFDTVTGSGAARGGADLVQHGPLIGLGFAF